MKDKIMLFIIGVLVGAVISTGIFFVYTKAITCNSNNTQQTQMNGGTPPSMPGGDNNQSNSNGQPPEKPSDSNEQNSNDNSS